MWSLHVVLLFMSFMVCAVGMSVGLEGLYDLRRTGEGWMDDGWKGDG